MPAIDQPHNGREEKGHWPLIGPLCSSCFCVCCGPNHLPSQLLASVPVAIEVTLLDCIQVSRPALFSFGQWFLSAYHLCYRRSFVLLIIHCKKNSYIIHMIALWFLEMVSSTCSTDGINNDIIIVFSPHGPTLPAIQSGTVFSAKWTVLTPSLLT